MNAEEKITRMHTVLPDLGIIETHQGVSMF
jgi:hypothetical protein